MRLGLIMAVVTLLVACSEDRAAKLREKWHCAAVEGTKVITGERAPDYVLIGEFLETNEGPAAFAEVVCNIAAERDAKAGPLFVGASDYSGGATDAETRMRQRLDELAAKGAPIVIGSVAEDHPFSARERTAAEMAWASSIMAKVSAANASQAVLFLARSDAIAETIEPTEGRYSGYTPMPLFLPDGEVMSLEIAANPLPNFPEPVVRIHRQMEGGFHGQLMLPSLTRSTIAVLMPDPKGRSKAEAAGEILNIGARDEPTIHLGDIRALIQPAMTRAEKIAAVAAAIEAQEKTNPNGAGLSKRRSGKLAEILVDQLEKAEKSAPD